MLTLVKTIVWLALVMGAVVGALRATCLRFWTMPGDDPLLALSVLPTLEAGDGLLLFRLGSPSFGDLVRCPDPEAPGRFVVGRILGEQGDRIVLDQSSITVNERHIGTRRACDTPELSVFDPTTGEAFALSCEIEDAHGTEYTRARATKPALLQTLPYRLKVPDGHVFLASDNRYYHDDSRDFGAVVKASCHERVVFRLWSGRGWFDGARRMSIIH